jgi:hypothetical protein
MMSGDLSPYLYGAVRYSDAYNRPGTHITKFCFNVASGMLSAKITIPIVSRCPYWNCSDDDCNADKAAYEKEIAGLSEEH